LSIWEEEGCRMVPMSCREHDTYAANSQFITHLMGRILGSQGLEHTPIDTSGFQSVLKLVDTTTADSFELFYGLYKYNQNSMATIVQLRSAMDDVVHRLKSREAEEQEKQEKQLQNNQKQTEH
jgi:arogenate dehydrogenase (NADP+)